MLQMLFRRAAPTLMPSSFPFAVAFQGFSCGSWSACGECRQGWRQVYTLAVVFQICSAPHKHCTEFWVPWVLFSTVVSSVSGNACIAAVLHPAEMKISCFVWLSGSCRIATPPLPLQCLLLPLHSIEMGMPILCWYHMML
jgi:hypothetical protein